MRKPVWDPSEVLSDLTETSRPATPPGQPLRAALPPTPLTPGWSGLSPPFPEVLEDELPPTPASLLDGGGEMLVGPA